MIRHFLNPPNWFTAASIFCSTYALTLLLSHADPSPEVLRRACVLIVFGGVFDLLDGRVARMTNRPSEFGVQLDSIADMFGFGVAPAMIAWVWSLHELGAVGVAFTFWYVLCAAFRLARFNVDTVENSWPFEGHTQGLTSTMSGGALVIMVWVCNGYLAGIVSPSPMAVGVFTSILGFLMISSVPFRHFKDLRRNPNARRLFAVALGACLTSALVLDPSMWWGTGAAMYLTLGLVDGLIVAVWHRRLARALLLSENDDDEIVVLGDL